MHLLCPHCQQAINVPDSSAGQTVDCPLCKKPFPAPALSLYAPPALATAPAPAARPADPEDDREPYGVVPSAANRTTFPNPEPPRPQPAAPPRVERPEPPPAAPSPGTAAGHHGFTIRLHLPTVQVITGTVLVVAFLLTFFSWSGSYPAGYGAYTQNAWQALFDSFSTNPVGEKLFGLNQKLHETIPANLLLLPYLLLLIAVCVLVAVEHILPHIKQPLPPQLQRLRPENYAVRHAIQSGLIFLALILLLIQIWFYGFGIERALGEIVSTSPEVVEMEKKASTPEELQMVEMKRAELLGRYQLERTAWLKLEVLALLIALLGLITEYWLVRRGTRPVPRFEAIW